MWLVAVTTIFRMNALLFAIALSACLHKGCRQQSNLPGMLLMATDDVARGVSKAYVVKSLSRIYNGDTIFCTLH